MMCGLLLEREMLNEDYREMLSTLLEEKVDFILVGAFAMAAHGYPRATGDIDIWIRPDPGNAKRVYAALARFGAPLSSVEPGDFSRLDLIFQIGVPPRRIDIITSIDGVSYDDAAGNTLVVHIEGMNIPILSLALLIKNKESTGRDKDRLDAQFLRKISQDQ
jgi:hypothetical protein